MNITGRDTLQYRVGGLLYCPAINEGLADKIARGAIPCLTSVALCLEDAISDAALPAAEDALCRTLEKLGEAHPLVFIRIRTPEHMAHIHERVARFGDVVTGYILPKFDLSNCDAYLSCVARINAGRREPVYIMPILESKSVADISGRTDGLLRIKDRLDTVREHVLNVRVGGNDFSNLYGLRRSVTQNIYQIGVIRDILTDVINVFAADYVVSGPVWEYFGDDPSGAWATGLRAELELDRLNGFVGKTAIHPSQLPLIYDSMRVKRSDYEDAQALLGWDDAALGVGKSIDGTRMNEVKCHAKWARRMLTLGDIYGICED